MRAVIGAVCLVVAAGCSDDEAAVPAKPTPPSIEPLETPPIHTPRWAFEPWISKDISDAADTYAFVEGFETRDIPVGVVVLDSPWETNYNTFVPSPTRYPDFDVLVADLAERDIRVVLWVTQLVNSSSFDVEEGGDVYPGAAENFDEAYERGFFVNSGEQWAWWKGTGGAIDFFNPEAVAWWHAQQNALFDMGVSGFKLDFGDSYVRIDEVQTHGGVVPHQEYSERYYADFFAHGVEKRGPEDFVTMVRPWDESYDFEGRFFARREHAPVAWVGDNRRDWIGLADALDHIFRSAAEGYVVVGSDLGGYLDRDDDNLLGDTIPFDPINFARWTAVSALTPFMQLHGRANLEPWAVPEMADEIVALYRYWATLHHELVPFLYSLAQKAYADGGPMMHPQGEPASWPGDYRWVLGDAFLVAPILDATGSRDVQLPSGARWYDWWDAAGEAIEGGTTLPDYDATDLGRIPLFVREGAIVPMKVASDVTGIGTAASSGSLTILVWPSDAETTFSLEDEDGESTEITAKRSAGLVDVGLSRAAKPTLARVRTDTAPTAVSTSASGNPSWSTPAARSSKQPAPATGTTRRPARRGSRSRPRPVRSR